MNGAGLPAEGGLRRLLRRPDQFTVADEYFRNAQHRLADGGVGNDLVVEADAFLRDVECCTEHWVLGDVRDVADDVDREADIDDEPKLDPDPVGALRQDLLQSGDHLSGAFVRLLVQRLAVRGGDDETDRGSEVFVRFAVAGVGFEDRCFREGDVLRGPRVLLGAEDRGDHLLAADLDAVEGRRVEF
ncbi:MAG: hypothetical protein JWO99_408 [Candidatus Saccharibacteria bacterium]|nr:hypothetical protein [Candidatus Saccharibacteria bacterium]